MRIWNSSAKTRDPVWATWPNCATQVFLSFWGISGLSRDMHLRSEIAYQLAFEPLICRGWWDDPTFPTLQIRLSRLTGVGEVRHDRDIKELKRLWYQTQAAWRAFKALCRTHTALKVVDVQSKKQRVNLKKRRKNHAWLSLICNLI